MRPDVGVGGARTAVAVSERADGARTIGATTTNGREISVRRERRAARAVGAGVGRTIRNRAHGATISRHRPYTCHRHKEP